MQVVRIFHQLTEYFHNISELCFISKNVANMPNSSILNDFSILQVIKTYGLWYCIFFSHSLKYHLLTPRKFSVSKNFNIAMVKYLILKLFFFFPNRNFLVLSIKTFYLNVLRWTLLQDKLLSNFIVSYITSMEFR